MIVIRKLTQTDSDAFAALIVELARETPFTALTEAEAAAAIPSQAQRTAQILAGDSIFVVVAEAGAELIGFGALTRGALQRNRHCCGLMLGVRATHWGAGLGRRILDELLAWMRSQGMRRLEASLADGNDRARAFYERCGFQREGRKRKALRMDHGFVDEIVLGLLLDP